MSEEGEYGKDLWGDLWEGKHTLILMHALRAAAPAERSKALTILRRPHPAALGPEGAGKADGLALIGALAERRAMTEAARAELTKAWSGGAPAAERAKTGADIEFLHRMVHRTGSIAYARRAAQRYTLHFQREIGRMLEGLLPSEHRQFLADLADFTINRQL